jgi:hypothetical protein
VNRQYAGLYPVSCGAMPCCRALRCVLWLYALSFSFTPYRACRLAVHLVVWPAGLSFGCWVVVWPAFGGSRCLLVILVVVWGIVVGVGLRGGQWG